MAEAANAHKDPVQAVRQPASPISRGLDQRNAARREYDAAAQRLPQELSEPMPARFGHDFSQVRVHTDAAAAQSALALGVARAPMRARAPRAGAASLPLSRVSASPGQLSQHSHRGRNIQRKLAIGRTDGPLEREADHIDELPPSVPEVLARDGNPLDSPLRAVMERRLGANLGAVRVHADDRAGESARAIRAKAYAVGHHVVFGPRRFNPATPEGKRLLAHELTHVVQQGAGTFPTPAPSLNPSAIGRADSVAEWEAGRNSSSAPTVSVTRSVPVGHVMREPEGSGEAKESGGIFNTIIGGLMGDFREDPSLAEIGVNTAVSLIPAVGEVTAARDVTANIYFMVEKEEYSSPGRWFGLVLALIALFPEIGAALKGLGKAILKGVGEALRPIVRLMERVLEALGHSEGTRGFFLKHWNEIVTKGMTLFETVMKRLSSLLTDAVRFVSSKADAFAQGLKRVREVAAKALPEAIDRAKNLIESVLERFGGKEEGQAVKTIEKEAEKTGTQLEKEGVAETEKAGAEAQKGVEEIETGTPPLTSIATPNRYVPDASGRAKLAEGWLKPTPGGRLPSAQAQLGKGYNVGSPRQFHATHLIADTLGGAGDARNLVMLDREINLGAIASLEGSLRKRISAGEQLFLRVQAQYVGGGSRSVMAERLIYQVFKSDGKSLVKDAEQVFEAVTKVH
jgi:uncharacterized protein DUF4157/DNA/RNA non-specific endonuclease